VPVALALTGATGFNTATWLRIDDVDARFFSVWAED
jgi:hypothetical protein